MPITVGKSETSGGTCKLSVVAFRLFSHGETYNQGLHIHIEDLTKRLCQAQSRFRSLHYRELQRMPTTLIIRRLACRLCRLSPCVRRRAVVAETSLATVRVRSRVRQLDEWEKSTCLFLSRNERTGTGDNRVIGR